MPNMLRKIVEFIVDKYYDVKYAIEHFFGWIIKSVQYSFFLWSDGDYDYGYILTLLRYKLKRTREHITKHKIHGDWKKICSQISKAEMFIEMIQENDFCKQEHKWLDRKWGKIVMKSKPAENGLREVELTRVKAKTKQEKRQERKDVLFIARLEQKRYNQCLKELFLHMANNIQNWWD